MSRTRRKLCATGVALAVALGSVVVASGDSSAGVADSRFAGGEVSVINGSGAWSWYEGPRALLTDCELLAGSVSNRGDVEVTTLDLASGHRRVDLLGRAEEDDHNSPGLLELTNGRILAAWSRHHLDSTVRNAYREPRVSSWSEGDQVVDRSRTTYSNLIHLTDVGLHGRVYNFFRGTDFNPVVSVSDDLGRNWKPVTPFVRKFASRPYAVYDDDGRRRIDFATTEGHPNEYDPGTGIFHGYIEGNWIRRSHGSIIAPLGYGIAPEELTRVYQQSPEERAWTLDVVTNGEQPVMAFSVRDLGDGVDAHLRNTYRYATFDGTSWQHHQIGFAGNSLYSGQQFYTGGVAIDPADPSHLVISTDVDPATGAPLPGGTHELFDAVTPDGGQTWTFTPITSASTSDNLRPVVPDPSDSTRALLWMQGSYRSYLDYDTQIVGIVDGQPGQGCPPPLDVAGAVPFWGDFDGDGRQDYFHYQPGSAVDTVHWGDGDRTVHQVFGTYEPVITRIGGRDAILWTSPTASYRWRASGHGFTSQRVVHASGVQLLVGDFDGDGTDDYFHYRPGPKRDRIYWSDGTNDPIFVNGVYQPVIGDFDGNGVDDILWYRPGSGADYYWLQRSNGTHRDVGTRISGTYTTAVGRLDGNSTDDIAWLSADGGGYWWLHRTTSTPSHVSLPTG